MTESDSLKIYMQNLEAFPRLTTKQENALAKKIANGDDNARKHLLECNLKLVVKIAHDYKGRGLPLADIIAEGNLGLLKAVEKFNPAFGAKFSSYSAYWIKQAMQRALSKQTRVIRIPVQTSQKLFKLNQAKLELQKTLGREPTIEEIVAKTKFSRRTVQTMQKIPPIAILSLADPIRSDEEGTIQDLLPDNNVVQPNAMLEESENMNNLDYCLKRLDENERLILDLRFGLRGHKPQTLEQVAHIVHKTRERVRQIQMDAIAKMREFFNETPSDHKKNARTPA